MSVQVQKTVAIIRKFYNADDSASVWAWSFDAIIRESHQLTSTVVKHPVASGGSIADHIYDDPDKLTIEGKVSDYDRFEHEGQLADVFKDQALSRSQHAFYMLDSLRRAHEPFNVQTGLRLYTNMVIERLSVDQDKSTSRVCAFKAELTQIVIVETKTRTYKVPAAKKKPKRQASEIDGKGKVETTNKQVDTPLPDNRTLTLKLLGEITGSSWFNERPVKPSP